MNQGEVKNSKEHAARERWRVLKNKIVIAYATSDSGGDTKLELKGEKGEKGGKGGKGKVLP